MTSKNINYANANALRQAITDRARDAASAEPATSVEKRLRQFAYARFLARIFSDVAGEWVLKGGVALLGRLPDARHSRDIDLARKSSSIDEVVEELESLAKVDLGDFFEFRLGRAVHEMQGAHVGVNILVVAYLGLKEFSRFGIDIVLDVSTTMDPETIEPHRPIDVVGLAESPWRIYPLVDHMADKFAAILETHGKRTSSRYRDLVDLALIASSERVDGAALRRAISTELRLRGISGSTPLRVPQGDAWRAGYQALLKDLPSLEMTFDDACNAAANLFSIVEEPTAGKKWNPTTRTWDEK